MGIKIKQHKFHRHSIEGDKVRKDKGKLTEMEDEEGSTGIGRNSLGNQR